MAKDIYKAFRAAKGGETVTASVELNMTDDGKANFKLCFL